jgi:t-SNARE complex subunit (syntaxin)
LDIISEELMKSNKNLVLTNQELNQASKLQRKSRKKYIVFAIILIALIGAGVGFFFFIN